MDSKARGQIITIKEHSRMMQYCNAGHLFNLPFATPYRHFLSHILRSAYFVFFFHFILASSLIYGRLRALANKMCIISGLSACGQWPGVLMLILNILHNFQSPNVIVTDCSLFVCLVNISLSDIVVPQLCHHQTGFNFLFFFRLPLHLIH